MRKNAVTLLLTIGLAACNPTEELPSFPKPGDATEVQRFSRGDGYQDAFVLKRSYPAADVLAHYSKVFDSWIPCYWDDRDWTGFGDVSGSKPRYVHQVARFWVRADNKVMVSLVARYYSEYATCRATPDNDSQRVSLLYAPVDDARAMARMIDAKCAAAPTTAAPPEPKLSMCSRRSGAG